MYFRNLQKILFILKEKISFIAQIFQKLLTPTNELTSMDVSYRFRTPFTSKGVQGSEALLEPVLKHFHPNFPLISDNLSWKISTLSRSKILGLFGNTLTVGQRYSRHRWEKLPEQVQRLLSQKRRTFS